MKEFGRNEKPVAWGTWEDARALRRWTFLQRTPQERLDWLVAALTLAYQSGALKYRRADAAEETAIDTGKM